MTETFTEKLNLAIERVVANKNSQAWTKALADLNDLAQIFNAKIEAISNKKYGTALRSVTLPEGSPLFEKFKAYRIALISEGRTKVIMPLSLLAVRADGRYPILALLDDTGSKIMGELDCREMLEAQFLMFVRHADSKFLSTVLEIKP